MSNLNPFLWMGITVANFQVAGFCAVEVMFPTVTLQNTRLRPSLFCLNLYSPSLLSSPIFQNIRANYSPSNLLIPRE